MREFVSAQFWDKSISECKYFDIVCMHLNAYFTENQL